MCTSVSTMIAMSIFKILISVFNLGSSQSGSYVPHGTLNWVISKMVWIKLQTMQITSSWRLAPQVLQLYELA